jgi:hypothetical protein
MGELLLLFTAYRTPIERATIEVLLDPHRQTMWTRGGRELVYRKADSVMVVSIDLEKGESGPPRALFAGPYPDNPGWTRPRSHDVSRRCEADSSGMTTTT